jgi:predicted membrane-bound spermidine synthase
MKKKLLLLSFVEGAAVMIAELCGARLLAPVFGSSLYVWASVMGITLFALAAGYFVGAYLSVRAQKEKILAGVLAIAALAILFMQHAAYHKAN